MDETTITIGSIIKYDASPTGYIKITGTQDALNRNQNVLNCNWDFIAVYWDLTKNEKVGTPNGYIRLQKNEA